MDSIRVDQTLAGRALRELQVLDCKAKLSGDHRSMLMQAMTYIGEDLGLECTGEEDGWNADGSVAFWSHDGDTCPIHEWLVPEDSPDHTEEEDHV